MTWTTPPGTYGAADPLFLLLLALAVEAYAGDRETLRRWIDPRPRVARLAAELARRLNRPERSARIRQLRGLLVLLMFGGAALIIGWLAALISRHYPFAWVLEFLLLTGLMTQRGSYRALFELRLALDSGSLVRAREALRPLTVGLMPDARVEKLAHREVSFIGLAGLADRLVAALVAPVFWYVALGLPGLFIVQTVQILASASHREDDAAGRDPYVSVAATSERVLLWLPDRLAAGLVILAAAFVPDSSPRDGLRALGRDAVSAWSALAGTLGLSPNDAESLDEPGLGDVLGTAQTLFLVTCLVQAGVITLLLLLRLGF